MIFKGILIRSSRDRNESSLWGVILNLIILNVSSKISAKAYKEIWLEITDGSPLRFHTRAR